MVCDKERLSKEILKLEKAIALAYGDIQCATSRVMVLEAELEDLKEEFFSLSGEDDG
jgi:hypothetical protein